jgi:CRP-like cAMP-binding protein
METIKDFISRHPFFKELDAKHVTQLGACATDVHYDADRFLFKEGGPADHMYIIREGRVRLEIYDARKGPVAVQTLDDDDLLGWSWMMPPYRWHFDARALVATSAVAFAADRLRQMCADDPQLGYTIMMRVAHAMAQRLQATRFQLMDLYRENA